MKGIILIFGLPGCGKTTLSRMLSKEYKIKYISTEEVRAEFLNISHETEDCDFTNAQQVTVYQKVIERVGDYINVEDNALVIVEGVYRSRLQRSNLYNYAKNNRINILTFYIRCDEPIVLQRLIERKKGKTLSPVGVNGYISIKKQFLFPQESENAIIVDNSSDIKVAFEIIRKTIECSRLGEVLL